MQFRIERTDWKTSHKELLAVRHEVFVIGQNVPIEIEVDEMDAKCQHFLACDASGKPIGTARADLEGHIGRVAVLDAWQKKNVGRGLMQAAMEYLRETGLVTAHVNSQTHAAAFYRKLGFREYGDEFEEAGIPHIAMTIQL